MTYREAMKEARGRYFQALLHATGNNVSQAADLADLSRTHFYKLLKASGIEPPRHGHRQVSAGNSAWQSLADQ